MRAVLRVPQRGRKRQRRRWMVGVLARPAAPDAASPCVPAGGDTPAVAECEWGAGGSTASNFWSVQDDDRVSPNPPALPSQLACRAVQPNSPTRSASLRPDRSPAQIAGCTGSQAVAAWQGLGWTERSRAAHVTHCKHGECSSENEIPRSGRPQPPHLRPLRSV